MSEKILYHLSCLYLHVQIALHHILEAAGLGDAASRIGAARGAATSSGNITGYQQILWDLHSNSHLLFVTRMIM